MSDLTKDIAVYEAIVDFFDRKILQDTNISSRESYDLFWQQIANQFPGGRIQLLAYIDTLKLDYQSEIDRIKNAIHN